tara:strand:+ start:636 stop:1067 length:432 start_codon:yes stop_codon:yes gene_type:complete
MTTLVQTDGEFKGWTYWVGDKYESETVGPFYYRREESGQMVGAFRAEPRHMNGHGNMHGGCMMSFADFGLFTIAEDALNDGSSGVTLSMNSEFLSAAIVGDLMEVRGEVLRSGRSVIFVRGMVTANGKPCLNFSGTIKRVSKR